MLFVLIGFLFLLQWLLQPAAIKFPVKRKVFVGKVVSIPQYNRIGERFVLKTNIGKLQVALYQRDIPIHAGEYWRLYLQLKPIHGLSNPAGFNAVRWAKQQGIIAKAYVVTSIKPTRVGVSHFSVLRFRERIQQSVIELIKNKNLCGVIDALTMGARTQISADSFRVFQRTGTSHLIAISGLHVGLVFTIFYFLLRQSLRLLPFIFKYVPMQRLASLIALLIALLYGLLVGLSIPTQRALIMLAVWVFFSWHSRLVSVFMRLAIAFLLVLAWQPYAIYSVSFWLSFLAVFFLAYATVMKQRMQWVLSCGLLPVSLYSFHQYALVSVLANVIAIPWISFVIVPLCLLAVLLFMLHIHLAKFIWILAAKCLWPLWSGLTFLAHFSWSIWLHPINDIFVMIAACMACVCFFAPRALPIRSLGVLLFAPLLFYTPSSVAKNHFCLTVLDVGQGLSSVIRTAKHVLVFDAGPRFITGFDAGRSVLMPYLQTIGVRQIDTLMISHGDNDHIGGSYWLDRHFMITRILTSIPRSRWTHPFQHCYVGQTWQWDGVSFQVLWPPSGMSYKGNNSSCVLRVSVDGHAILLTGDIEKPVENALVRSGKLLPAEILVAPHHGSASSSSTAFLRAINPKWVIFPVGFMNRFHFPAASVLKRYRHLKIAALSTAEQGAISVCFGPNV